MPRVILLTAGLDGGIDVSGMPSVRSIVTGFMLNVDVRLAPEQAEPELTGDVQIVFGQPAHPPLDHKLLAVWRLEPAERDVEWEASFTWHGPDPDRRLLDEVVYRFTEPSHQHFTFISRDTIPIAGKGDHWWQVRVRGVGSQEWSDVLASYPIVGIVKPRFRPASAPVATQVEAPSAERAGS
jgi:hypothetical protein